MPPDVNPTTTTTIANHYLVLPKQNVLNTLFAYPRFKDSLSSLLDGSVAGPSKSSGPCNEIWASLPNLTGF